MYIQNDPQFQHVAAWCNCLEQSVISAFSPSLQREDTVHDHSAAILCWRLSLQVCIHVCPSSEMHAYTVCGYFCDLCVRVLIKILLHQDVPMRQEPKKNMSPPSPFSFNLPVVSKTEIIVYGGMAASVRLPAF